MATVKDFDTVAKPDWCPGCGNFAIQAALKQALTNQNIEPHNVALVAGIGCSSKIAHWLNVYGLHTLHGRGVPPAEAVKFVNPELTVVAAGGDGDGYGIGIGHFVHAMRRNVDMIYLIHDNKVYGLTKGQATPTSDKGQKSPSTPFGAIEEPLNPVALALVSGATFVARATSADVTHLTMVMEEAIKHKGFAFIDILQPCVTFDKKYTYAFYLQNCVKIENDKDYDKSNFEGALKKAYETGKIPIGIFYQAEKPTYGEQDPGHTKIPVSALDISNIEIDNAFSDYF